MPKIKIQKELFERIKQHAEEEGYSSVDEFVTHALEKELGSSDKTETDEPVTDRLKGLGYIE